MKKTDISALLRNLTGNLQPAQGSSEEQLNELRTEIVRALASQTETQEASFFFQVERTDQLEEELSETPALTGDLEAFIEEALAGEKSEEEEEYRVFRRSSPIRSAQIPGSTPSWGRGAEVAFSRGPFLDANGLWFWFDFFKITRMVAIHFSNSSAPAILLPLKLSIFFSSQKSSYSLGKGSIWIRSDLFAPGTPPNTYVGLKVKGGEINFSQPVTVVNDQVVVPLTASMDLELELDPVQDTSTYNESSGSDVRNSSIELPSSCQFAVTATSLVVNEIEGGQWKIYHDARSFSFQNGTADYSPLLDHILIDFETDLNSFTVEAAELDSKIISLEGEAPVIQAAWALPLTTLSNPSGPVPDAAGTGAWALEIGQGIFAHWFGLDEGPVDLRDSWMVLEPGQFDWVSPTAGNIYAQQSYELWPNESTHYYAKAHLQYSKEFPFRYQAMSEGAESILTTCDTDIQTDRPVRVHGRPFEVTGKDSLFLLYDIQELRRILLYDPNILQDNLDKTAGQAGPYESHAIALNNVLLTVSQVMAFLLSGTLASATQLEKGNLHLLHALFRWLPTLPDPYAANVGRLFREQDRPTTNRPSYLSPIAFLLASVSWPYLSIPEDPVQARVDYQFFPFFQKNRTHLGIEAVGTARFLATEAEAQPSESASMAAINVAAATVSKEYRPEDVEGPWRELISNFGQDLFALLDVSTRADLMGVMYGGMNERYIYKITHVPAVDGDVKPVPFQIDGLDLKASGKYVKAFTVPLVSWEPVLNTSGIDVLAPPAADPPAGTPQNPTQLRFPNDGGPTRIFNTSLKTVTLAPIPLSDFIIEEFKGDDEPLTFSIFTLPYGMQAVALFEKKNPFGGDLASAIDFNRPAFEDDVQGGIQFKATAADNPDQGNRTFRGNTIQLANLITSKPNQTSILGETVTEIFNREFSSANKGPLIDRGVPVERIDISGYGSSMFSNWLNDKAKFAQTSQAKFDVITGRTAHEIIQVRSILYPWGVGVVRTIVLYRPSSGFVYRVDSGWRADSDGLFDFNVNVKVSNAGSLIPRICCHQWLLPNRRRPV